MSQEHDRLLAAWAEADNELIDAGVMYSAVLKRTEGDAITVDDCDAIREAGEAWSAALEKRSKAGRELNALIESGA